MNKIGVFYTMILFITSIGMMIYVTAIPFILDVAKRDAWMSPLFSLGPYLLFLLVVYFILKKLSCNHLFDWLKERVGTIITYAIVTVLSIHLLLLCLITLTETTSWIKVTYLPAAPSFIIALTFIFLCYYAAKSGLNAIVVTNGLLLPLTLLLSFFIAFANHQRKSYKLLAPFFEHGLSPAISGMWICLAVLSELMFIFFLQHHVKKKIKFSHLLITGLFLLLSMIGPILGSITEFGPIESSKQRYPTYEQWALVTLSVFIEHADFFSLYQWLSSAFIRISLYMYFIPELIKMKMNKNRTRALKMLFFVLAILILLPSDEIQIYRYIRAYLHFSLIFNSCCLLILLTLCFKKKRSLSS